MAETSAAEEHFAAILEALSSQGGVTLGSGRRGFGSDALCVHGRIFAIPRPGGLVLKLPRARVAELIASGEGTPFDAGKGKPMKEWVVLERPAQERWLQLTREALAFVGAGSESSRSA
jgi:hypothetical protein